MLFEKIDKALNRYYESLGRLNYTNDSGIGKFLAFCEENEADPDDIEDELEDFENCMYLDFDENFPFEQEYKNKNHTIKQQFIFNLIKKCYSNPNISFTRQNNIAEIDDNKERIIITEPKVLATCGAINRYYSSINRQYDQIFSIYCYDNGVDDELLYEELKQDVSECTVIDFDSNFPFKYPLINSNLREQQEFLFDLIRDCYNNPNRMFNPYMPQCLLSTSTLKYLYTITEEFYFQTKKIYFEQCPTLWNSGMDLDKGFTYAISIGRKYNFNYLQYLVDDYHRSRVLNINKSYTIEDWCMNHSHFCKLKSIKFTPPWKKEEDKTQKEVEKEFKYDMNNKNNFKTKTKGPQNAYDVVIGAIRSYEVRCIPKLQFKNLKTINDSLEIIIRYIDAVIGFIRGRIDASNNRKMPICPFQIDFAIAGGEPKLEEKNVETTFEDDDDDDIVEQVKVNIKKDIFIDAIGNIKEKLIANKLKYKLGNQTPQRLLDFEFMSKRGLSTIFERFIEENGLLKDKGTKQHPEIYLHNKRLIIFVDRRHKTGKMQDLNADDIWIYEPPKNCINIPNKTAVFEWHISASKTCILPNMKYGDGKQAENEGMIDENENENENENDDSKEKDNKKIKNANINSSFHCKGALMTLSFIVESENSIKAYLYWNGQMTRFMPQDCKTVLPEIFNMKWNNGIPIENTNKSVNEIFLNFKDSNQIEPNDIDSIIKRMKKNMKDVYFDNNICLRNTKFIKTDHNV